MYRPGEKVKIPDIGPLATVILPGKHMAKLELEGEQFWIGTELLKRVEMEVA